MIIGVTGTVGSGKGTFCEHIESKECRLYGFGVEVSGFIKEDLLARGPLNREMMQFWGEQARRIYSAGFWDLRIINKIKNSGFYNNVIDGFRYPDQIERVMKFARGFGDERFYLVGVDSEQKIRFRRLNKRGREGDPETWKDFLEMDKRDMGGYNNGLGQDTEGSMKMADKIILNNGTLEDLRREGENFMASLRSFSR